MSLLDDLRQIEHFPPSHIPTVTEVLQVVGVLAAYVEHGDELLQAVKDDAQAREAGEKPTAVDELLDPQPDDTSSGSAASPPASVAPAAVPPGDATDKDDRIAELKRQLAAASDEPDPRDAEIQALEQQIATKRANEQRTQVSVQPGETPSPLFGAGPTSPSSSPTRGPSSPTPGPEAR